MSPGPRPGRGLPLRHQSAAWQVLDVAGVTITWLWHRSGLSEGTLSRALSGERGIGSRNLLKLLEALAPTVAAVPSVPPLVMLRALVATRERWLKLRKVGRLIDSR